MNDSCFYVSVSQYGSSCILQVLCFSTLMQSTSVYKTESDILIIQMQFIFFIMKNICALSDAGSQPQGILSLAQFSINHLVRIYCIYLAIGGFPLSRMTTHN